MEHSSNQQEPVSNGAITLAYDSAQDLAFAAHAGANNRNVTTASGQRRAIPNRIIISNGNQYVVESELGVGGLGVVYLARAIQTNQLVALKLPVRLNDIVAQNTVRKEAQILSNLNHDHIIKLVAYGSTIDAEPYLCLEYIEAPTLEQLLKIDQSLSLARAIDICTQVADALEYMHLHNLIHNDLKPSNILIANKDGADWAYVLDFGIAQDQNILQVDTDGPMIATLLYAPPERCNQTAQTKSSDVYQLGLILYECLTGQLPFDVSFAAVMDHRSNGDIVPALSQSGSCILPRSIKSLLQKAIARDPKERPESMQALLHEMRQAVSSIIGHDLAN